MDANQVSRSQPVTVKDLGCFSPCSAPQSVASNLSSAPQQLFLPSRQPEGEKEEGRGPSEVGQAILFAL